MSYNSAIPQSTDDPRDSQAQILSNFTVIGSAWSQNHVALTQSTNAGMHTKVFFEAPITAPGLTAPKASLYTKAIDGNSELFFQNGANASNEKQLTNLKPTTSGTQHQFITPWSLIIQMGTGTGTGTASNRTLTYATPMPGTPVIYTALATGVDCTRVRIISTSGTAINYSHVGGTGEINFFILASR